VHRAQPAQAGRGEAAGRARSDVTLSALESGLLALLERHALPRPRTNVDRRGD